MVVRCAIRSETCDIVCIDEVTPCYKLAMHRMGTVMALSTGSTTESITSRVCGDWGVSVSGQLSVAINVKLLGHLCESTVRFLSEGWFVISSPCVGTTFSHIFPVLNSCSMNRACILPTRDSYSVILSRAVPNLNATVWDKAHLPHR